jgi:hypothetical protein
MSTDASTPDLTESSAGRGPGDPHRMRWILSGKWIAQKDGIGRSQTLVADHLLQLGDVLNLLDLQYLDHRRRDTAGNFEANDIVFEHLLSQERQPLP